MSNEDSTNAAGLVEEAGIQECPVCLQQPTNPVSPRCRHVFCRKCIQSCIKLYKRCPMCNRSIKNQKELKKISKSRRTTQIEFESPSSSQSQILNTNANVVVITNIQRRPLPLVENSHSRSQVQISIDPFIWLEDSLQTPRYMNFEEFNVEDLEFGL